MFGRGAPEPIADIKRPEWTATLYDLLSAYAQQRQKRRWPRALREAPGVVAAEAREALERLIGQAQRLEPARSLSVQYLVEPSMRATVLASSFAATLEMVREGALEMHQQSAFAPIFLRKHERRGAAPLQRSGSPGTE